jgi:hypothetical protein
VPIISASAPRPRFAVDAPAFAFDAQLDHRHVRPEQQRTVEDDALIEQFERADATSETMTRRGCLTTTPFVFHPLGTMGSLGHTHAVALVENSYLL